MSLEIGRERREKKRPFIVATYVYASSQGQHTSPLGTKWHFYETHILIKLVFVLVF
jgi:hypothetical protein